MFTAITLWHFIYFCLSIVCVTHSFHAAHAQVGSPGATYGALPPLTTRFSKPVKLLFISHSFGKSYCSQHHGVIAGSTTVSSLEHGWSKTMFVPLLQLSLTKYTLFPHPVTFFKNF